MKRLAGGLATLAVLLSLAACGGTTDRQGDAYKAVVGFTQALENRDYGTACAYYSKELTPAKYKFVTTTVSGTQLCALNLEYGEAQSLMFFGEPVYFGFKVDPVPVVDTKHKAPINGYVYKVKFSQGVVFISVQRDSKGVWKVTAISS